MSINIEKEYLMENFLVCLNAVLPIFFIMALGYVARLTGVIRREDVPAMNRVAFKFFMPIMLFYDIYKSDLGTSVRPALIAFAVTGVLCAYGLSLLYVLLTQKKEDRKGVMIQGLYRSNYVIIGLPIAKALAPGMDIGSVAVLVAIIVPIFNVLAVITLEVFAGKKIKAGGIALDVAKNPLIIASVLGFIAMAAGLKLPAFADSVLEQVGGATSPLLLFLLGAFFQFKGMKKYLRELIEACLGRLVVIPAIFLGAAALLGFRGVDFVALIGIFGSATAIASFTMTQQMGGDAELAGDIVVLTSAGCSVTIFAWSLLFKTLGIF